ncbi:transcriptional repressor [Alphaproteobacteria bacterium]|nr:transcriptional repressor [Alphaproteobacteria bacterium]
MKFYSTDELLNHCIQNKKSLTPSRSLVIKILSRHSKPQSAYNLLDEINKENNTNLNISTIYRVLDFWMDLGLIHKISAINKYLICLTPSDEHTHILNYCTKCENVIETCNKKMASILNRAVKKLNLSLNNKYSVEIPVICSKCS